MVMLTASCLASKQDPVLHMPAISIQPNLAGSQALVAYSLQKSLPDSQFSMVAEEDSADLRCEGH